MAKKKKKLDDAAWLWMSQPLLPGMTSIAQLDPPSPTMKFSRTGHDQRYIDRLRYLAEEKPEYPHDGFIRAMKEYAYVALLDPTNIPEARVWAGILGVGYATGMGVTMAKGLILGPPILATVDPQHRWEGGLDEFPVYKAAVNTIAYTNPELPREIIMGGGSWGSVV
jgi:hypothetical protein